MLTKHQTRTTRLPAHRGAAQRLTEALNALTRQSARAAATVTATQLCRVADVSRNSLYRYHAPILEALREHQRHGLQAARVTVRKSADQRRAENVVLRNKLEKLSALVDHYYAAYGETSALLQRRERELAELRRKLAGRPTLVPSLGRARSTPSG